MLEAALGELERLGAAHWAACARTELDSLSLGPDGTFTAAEQRVVDLALKGHTSREIAARLYIGVRTVESHLSSVYRKQGVRGRGELAYRLTAPTVSGIPSDIS